MKESHHSIGLRTLEDISSIILHSHDLHETLDNIVTIVAKRMKTDVCSIYLLEKDGETLLLKATKGLSKASVDRASSSRSSRRARNAEGSCVMAALCACPVRIVRPVTLTAFSRTISPKKTIAVSSVANSIMKKTGAIIANWSIALPDVPRLPKLGRLIRMNAHPCSPTAGNSPSSGSAVLGATGPGTKMTRRVT
jgi:GAF domain-containing protein